MIAAVARPPLWDRSCFTDESTGEDWGISAEEFARAVQIWSYVQQGRPTTVAEAAAVFNVAPKLIIEAVDQHAWMFLDGDRDDPLALIIEHEGE